MIVEVETGTGPGGRLEPRRLRLGERTLELTEVLDAWPGVGHTYFKVRADSGALYILRHDETRALWELTLFQAPDRRAM